MKNTLIILGLTLLSSVVHANCPVADSPGEHSKVNMSFPHAIFSNPDIDNDNPIQQNIINLINATPCGGKLILEVYFMDDDSVHSALVSAHERGVHVTVLLDDRDKSENTHDLVGKVDHLQFIDAGSSSIMHNKVGLFSVVETDDGPVENIVFTSSSNIKSSSYRKYQDALIISDENIFDGFIEQAEQIKSENKDYIYSRLGSSPDYRAYFFPRQNKDTVADILKNLRENTSYGDIEKFSVKLNMGSWTRSRSNVTSELKNIANLPNANVEVMASGGKKIVHFNHIKCQVGGSYVSQSDLSSDFDKYSDDDRPNPTSVSNCIDNMDATSFDAALFNNISNKYYLFFGNRFVVKNKGDAINHNPKMIYEFGDNFPWIWQGKIDAALFNPNTERYYFFKKERDLLGAEGGWRYIYKDYGAGKAFSAPQDMDNFALNDFPAECAIHAATYDPIGKVYYFFNEDGSYCRKKQGNHNFTVANGKFTSNYPSDFSLDAVAMSTTGNSSSDSGKYYFFDGDNDKYIKKSRGVAGFSGQLATKKYWSNWPINSVQYHNISKNTHSKYMLVEVKYKYQDEPVKIVYAGSENLTYPALKSNYESWIKVISDDIYDEYNAHFEGIVEDN